MTDTTRTRIGEIAERVGATVSLSGFVDSRRDHGKLVFFDLRDETGIVQVVAIPSNGDAYAAAEKIRPEWVVSVDGLVKERPAAMVNRNLPNGAVEIEAISIKVLSEAQTPPFDLKSDGREIGEETRLAYRYLDLRRPRLANNIRMRHRAFEFIRRALAEEGFVEIETPILTKSTPEGARDYLVPSRLERGKFYALPQSPQQYKQLLMVAGFERYFQFARCMRDEDTRGDRQPEFTQLDIEMSFVGQEDILALTENLFTRLVHELYPKKRIAKTPWPRLSYADAMEQFGSDRPDLREDKSDPDELAFAWVLDFPLFEAEKNGVYAPSHHMFTAPKEEDIPKLSTDPASVRSYQHDLVLNGFEVGGGSIRIHDPKLQEKIFDLIGFGEKDKRQFSHMLAAFAYGAPPHGGIAPGMDRLLMILQGEPNIREVIAFPKTGEGRDLTVGAPSEPSEDQLRELGISVKPAP